MKIKIRKWELSDIDNLVQYANNFQIARWLTNAFPHPYNRQDGEFFIQSSSVQDPLTNFAIDVDNEAVGGIGLTVQTDIHCKNAEMGYWLAESYWGKEIVPAAIQLIVDYGFKTFDINRIFARPFGNNLKSQRVLEKSGFSLEARLEKTLYKNGEYMDEIIYAIRNEAFTFGKPKNDDNASSI